MSSRAINSIATVCGCCVDVHIIYFLASEKKQTAGKHIAKVQTASIRCVENPLSVKLFAQGQQRWQRGQNENENENDSGERASRRVGQNKPIPKIYIYIYILLKLHSAAKCVGKFLAARELFEEKISVAISAPRSVLHFSLMAVSVLL